MHHGRFSNNRLELVYTKYEVNRSIIKEDGCIQPNNPVFSTLTTGRWVMVLLTHYSCYTLGNNVRTYFTF